MYAKLILPLEFKTKEEIEQLKKIIRKMGKQVLIDHLIGLGWSLKSSEIIAEAMIKDVNTK